MYFCLHNYIKIQRQLIWNKLSVYIQDAKLLISIIQLQLYVHNIEVFVINITAIIFCRETR